MTQTMPGAQEFQSFIGAALSVQGGPDLMLVRVHGPQLGFALLLRGPASPVLAEGTYTLTLPSGGSWAPYMMPVHTWERDAQDYQIIVT